MWGSSLSPLVGGLSLHTAEGASLWRSGALFCVYWLMRLELAEVPGSEGLGGQNAFCLGVDDTSAWETVLPPTATGGNASAPLEMDATRVAFLRSHDWLQLHALMIDAGLLIQLENGGVKVCVERTRAMLALTAIHDVMKMEELLPTVLVCRS